MCHGIEQVVLAGNRLPWVEKRKLSARGVPDLKGALVEVSRPRPEPIGCGAIACAIYAMTPDTFAEIDFLSGFDHGGVWYGGIRPFDEPRRERRVGSGHVAGRKKDGHADRQPEGECHRPDHHTLTRYA
jgi:hypothetical protein